MNLNEFDREELQIHKDVFMRSKFYCLTLINVRMDLMSRKRVSARFMRSNFRYSTFLYHLIIVNSISKMDLKDINFQKLAKILQSFLSTNISQWKMYQELFNFQEQSFADVLQKSCFKTFINFKQKCLCWNLFVFLITPTQVFSCEISTFLRGCF